MFKPSTPFRILLLKLTSIVATKLQGLPMELLKRARAKIKATDKGVFTATLSLIIYVYISYKPLIEELSIESIVCAISKRETTNAAIIAFIAALIAHSSATSENRRKRDIEIQSTRLKLAMLLPVLSDFCKNGANYIDTCAPMIKSIQEKESGGWLKALNSGDKPAMPSLSSDVMALLDAAVACPVVAVSSHIASLAADLKVMETRMAGYAEALSKVYARTLYSEKSFDYELLNMCICKRNIDALYDFVDGKPFLPHFELGVYDASCSILEGRLVTKREAVLALASNVENNNMRYIRN